MSEQQLARALIQAGRLTPQQAQTAAQGRMPGKNFAQVLVEMGLVSAMDILQFDPQAFAAPIEANAAPADTNGASNGASNGYDAPEEPEIEVGLGQGGGLQLANGRVVIGDEEERLEHDPSAGPIVLYTNELLKIAVELGASDMHLEPRGNGLLPRYRVDGQLRPGELIPVSLQPSILSRLKVLANLDITEQRLPQDGRFRATIGGHLFDFRVSTLPSMHGEKIVLRLLDRSSLVTDLSRLGFSTEMRGQFNEMLQRAQGMILVTGPTGSGKTTTLYGALAAARDETKNVVTVEDPVEYELEGVTQTNVQSDIGLTFAAQLRAILRQDPDVILVGEIRDAETADIAIRAALTGHLVLSTLHTNSAVAAIARLRDMGIEPFLLASSLSGVLAQRLVRLICRHCRAPIPMESKEYQEAAVRLKLPPETPLFKGAGCQHCGGTGLRGRLALVELLPVERAMRIAIGEKRDDDTLRQIATEHGMKTLWQDGLDKLRKGLTTYDEIARVLLGAHETGEIEETTVPV